MLATKLADDQHGCSRLVNEVPALFDLRFHAPFELFLRYEVIDQCIVEQHRLQRLLTVARAGGA